MALSLDEAIYNIYVNIQTHLEMSKPGHEEETRQSKEKGRSE